MRALLVRISAAAVAAAVSIACSSSSQSPGTSPAACDSVDYSTFDGQNPAVSFRNDVLPIQRRACAFSSCHGKLVGSQVEMYLGPNVSDPAPDDATIADIIATMKAPSATAPSMPRVTPGDAQNSFLMLKLDGCQGEANLTCQVQAGALSNNPCGDTMPRSGDRLSRAERDVYRRWIIQGAQDN